MGRDSVRVLIVDDSPAMSEQVVRCLQRTGFLDVVGVARDGQEAITEVAARWPDLVIMDLNMPKMGGIEATRHIKAMPDPPPVIAFSLQPDQARIQAVMSAGADAVCDKVEPLDALIEAILGLFPELRPGA